MTTAKLPPYSLEAEQAVLGGLMLDDQAWDRIADRVSANDFYRNDHRLIFDAIRGLAEDSKRPDAVTLSEWLKSRGSLEEAGGLNYLVTLSRETPSAANIRAYADIVREQSVLRQLIRTGTEIADLGFHSEGRPSNELLNDAEGRIFAIAEQTQRIGQGFVAVGSVLKSVNERIHLLSESDDPFTGLQTGLADLDRLTSGLQRGDLIIVAARPSMGKTSLAMNFVEYASIYAGEDKRVPSAIFSMEMSVEQLTMRLMSSLGRINLQAVRTGKLQDTDWPRLTNAVHLLQNAPIFIDPTPAMSPTELHARARRLKRENPTLGLIVVDYLQLMQVAGTKENRTTEVSEISRSLKALAKELDVPVVALSQLSRNPEARPNKRPVMSDLRESGSIEQDADVVLFIYRDVVYNPDTDEKNVAELIIAKQRNGPTDTVKTAFRNEYTKFDNLAFETYPEEIFT